MGRRLSNFLFPTLSICVLLGSCTNHKPPLNPAADSVVNSDYVDIKAGYRIRVVVPILQSGGYITPMATKVEGNVIIVTTGKDFIGYENDHYTVRSRNSPGISITFTGAEAVENGKPSKKNKPALELFKSAPDIRFVRLIYLVRGSEADHDMVVVGARDQDILERLTSAVISNDTQGCKLATEAICLPIPRGIAVIPEESGLKDGHIAWISAR